jgi:hypothetical protein
MSNEAEKAEDVCLVHNSTFKEYIEEFGKLYGYRNAIAFRILKSEGNHFFDIPDPNNSYAHHFISYLSSNN